MFENLTQRERILAGIVLALVPIAILFGGVFWFINQYNDANLQIQNLSSQVSEQQKKLAAGIKANQRRIYYRSVSVPANLDDARIDYQQWLKRLVEEQAGMQFQSITPRASAAVKHEGTVIGKTAIFTLSATSNLEQLVNFLTQFYQLDLLHRVNSITVLPRSAGTTGAAAKIRSGKLKLDIEIEVLSLRDADAERDFLANVRDLPFSADNYRESILKRNIFGPANNTPTVSVSKSGSYTSNRDTRLTISGKDADTAQLLTFELSETSVAEATLAQKSPKDRRVYLSVPGQPAGQYKFKVRVSDNGFPSKSSESEFQILFKDRVVKKPPPPPPPKPDFVHARETRISAIVKDRDGVWWVWVKVRTTGDKHRLKIDDEFTLDGKSWTVRSIEPGQATFEVDGKMRTRQRNAPFATSDADTAEKSNASAS